MHDRGVRLLGVRVSRLSIAQCVQNPGSYRLPRPGIEDDDGVPGHPEAPLETTTSPRIGSSSDEIAAALGELLG